MNETIEWNETPPAPDAWSCAYCHVGTVTELPSTCPNCTAHLTIQVNGASFAQLREAARANAHVKGALLRADNEWLMAATPGCDHNVTLAE